MRGSRVGSHSPRPVLFFFSSFLSLHCSCALIGFNFPTYSLRHWVLRLLPSRCAPVLPRHLPASLLEFRWRWCVRMREMCGGRGFCAPWLLCPWFFLRLSQAWRFSLRGGAEA